MKRGLVIGLALVLALAAVWLSHRLVQTPEPLAPTPVQEEAPPLPEPAVQPDEPRTPLDELNHADTAQQDVQLMARAFIHYQRMVKDPGENPVGLNAEITRALTGQNRAGLALIPSNHPAINPQGELVDRWGRPYFFHALSSRRMQVRSGGPDLRMWTGDDVVDPPDQGLGSEAQAAEDTAEAKSW